MIPWDDHQFDYPLAATMSLILLSRLRIPVVAAEILSGGWLRVVGQTSKDGAMIIGSKTYLLTPDEKHIFGVVDNTTQEQGITKLKWFTLGS